MYQLGPHHMQRRYKNLVSEVGTSALGLSVSQGYCMSELAMCMSDEGLCATYSSIVQYHMR